MICTITTTDNRSVDVALREEHGKYRVYLDGIVIAEVDNVNRVEVVMNHAKSWIERHKATRG